MMLRSFCCKLFVAIVSGILGVGMSTTAQAGQNSYICTVETTYSAFARIRDDEKATKLVDEQAKVATIAIDRNTGRIIHPQFDNAGSHIITSVLHRGSSGSSFKLMSKTVGGGHVIYVEVEEFVEGFKKPMLLAAEGRVHLGTCQ